MVDEKSNSKKQKELKKKSNIKEPELREFFFKIEMRDGRPFSRVIENPDI